MSAVLKKSTPGKFAYTCHFQQIEINTKKIEKTGIHFKTDVFAALPSSMLKLPIRLDHAGNARFHALIYAAVIKTLSVSRTFLKTKGKDLIRKRACAFWGGQTELSLTGSRFIVKVFPVSR